MSLINKMLQDLETRDRSDAGTGTSGALRGLRSIHEVSRPSVLPRLLMVSVLLVLCVGAGTYFFVEMSDAPRSTNVAAQKTSEAPALAPVIEPAEPAVKPVRLKEVKPSAPAPVAVARKAPVASESAPSPVAAARKPAPPAAPAAERDAVIEKVDRPVNPREQAEARYRQAANQVAQGRGEQARATLNAALAAFPEHHQARELAAGLALQSGHVHEAQELLTQGLVLAPQRLSFAKLLARTHLQQGSEARAIETLEGARPRAADDADFLSLLAALYQRDGRHADAVAAYREAIAARTQDARAWLGLGISLDALQDGEAEEAYSRALQLGVDANLAQYARQRLAAIKR